MTDVVAGIMHADGTPLTDAEFAERWRAVYQSLGLKPPTSVALSERELADARAERLALHGEYRWDVWDAQRASGQRGLPSSQTMWERAVAPGGGFTIQPVTGNEPTEGFAVAVPGHSGIVSDQLTEEQGVAAIDQWLQANAEVLDSSPAMHVGAWHDEVHGEVVLDPSEVFTPDQQAAAIAAGVARDQQAIYNLGTGQEIPTGGTGGRPEGG